jgi:hypothetical protein
MSALAVDRRDPDALAIAIVLATIAVSVLCCAFLLQAGIVIA